MWSRRFGIWRQPCSSIHVVIHCLIWLVFKTSINRGSADYFQPDFGAPHCATLNRDPQHSVGEASESPRRLQLSLELSWACAEAQPARHGRVAPRQEQRCGSNYLFSNCLVGSTVSCTGRQGDRERALSFMVPLTSSAFDVNADRASLRLQEQSPPERE